MLPMSLAIAQVNSWLQASVQLTPPPPAPPLPVVPPAPLLELELELEVVELAPPCPALLELDALVLLALPVCAGGVSSGVEAHDAHMTLGFDFNVLIGHGPALLLHVSPIWVETIMFNWVRWKTARPTDYGRRQYRRLVFHRLAASETRAHHPQAAANSP